MLQLLLHLLGDFVLQNNWMAAHKSKLNREGYLACTVHCLVYSLPFLIITDLTAWLVIFSTHWLIDKFSLAKYVCRIKNWHFETDHGFAASTPPLLAMLLVMVVDNTMHIAINYFSITYL